MTAATPGPPVPLGDNRLGAVAADLAERGWTVLEDWLPAGLLAALADTAQAWDEADRTRPAAVGRVEDAVVDRTTRRARIGWLGGDGAAEGAFQAAAEALRTALNQRLFLGLFAFEACFVFYEAGGFYVRHADSLRGARNRVVSLVTYLNPEWDPAWRGALVLYGRDGVRATEVLPRAGVTVLLLSEEIEHEVLPTAASRIAIAGWWRVNEGMP